MKLALIVARFPSGWQMLACGEEVAAIKQTFKEVKLATFLRSSDEKEFASSIFYFDTGFNIRRKSLKAPESMDQVQALNAAAEQAAAEKRARAAEQSAVKEGQDRAAVVAAKVVDLVKKEVAGSVSVELAAPENETGADPENPAPASPAAEQPVASQGLQGQDESADGDEDHFGAKPSKRKRNS